MNWLNEVMASLELSPTEKIVAWWIGQYGEVEDSQTVARALGLKPESVECMAERLLTKEVIYAFHIGTYGDSPRRLVPDYAYQAVTRPLPHADGGKDNEGRPLRHTIDKDEEE